MKNFTCIPMLCIIAFLMACSSGKQTERNIENNENKFWEYAKTPPMGWNSWDCYGPTVTEAEVKANADYMAKELKQHGWEYIVVDIRWYVENDKAGGYNETVRFIPWMSLVGFYLQ